MNISARLRTRIRGSGLPAAMLLGPALAVLLLFFSSTALAHVARSAPEQSSHGSLRVSYVRTSADGIQLYDVSTPDDGPGIQRLRILAPSHPATGVAHNFLFVLPVEAGLGTTYGDGLKTLQRLDAENRYNLTIVEPSFAVDPWYANDPTDSDRRYETFMVDQLAPWVKANLAETGVEQSWLIGFSKSGIGAEDLILRHPDVFSLVASWDFPADMTSYTQYGAVGYGTQANFRSRYQLTSSLVSALKQPFEHANRIWIGGGEIFNRDVSSYDALLNREGVEHTTSPVDRVAHRWDSGWVPIALAALHADSERLRGRAVVHAKANHPLGPPPQKDAELLRGAQTAKVVGASL